MKTQDLVKGALNATTVAAGLYAGKFIRKQNYMGMDATTQNAIHIVLGAAVIPMFAKGKAAGYLNQFGAAIAGEALLDLVNGYLPADYQISGTDNSSYALGYSVNGADNRSYALGGTFPERASGSIPATTRVAG